jgi:RNA-splicing ligase RtcB
MFEIEGKYTKAKIYTDNVEPEALSQIYSICNHPAFEGESVRIMPDCHAGAGCVIGFTSTNNSGKIIPNLIGVDIGCGVRTVKLKPKTITNFEGLDTFIRNNIPHGQGVNDKIYNDIFLNDNFKDEIAKVCRIIKNEDKFNYHLKSIGSLGGGNHFCELSEDDKDYQYLSIHSGSRNFGHGVATYFQKQAEEECTEIGIDKSLKYLEGGFRDQYLRCMKIAQEFASINRQVMIDKILFEYLDITSEDLEDEFDTIHNYIDMSNVIRKGAVSAFGGQKLIIPINMRDGSLICEGRGNIDWNYSAPHGAGRVLSRRKAKENLSMEEFTKEMEGIYSTSVKISTLDESPMAYKSINDIIDNIGESVNILEMVKPKYNFKA